MHDWIEIRNYLVSWVENKKEYVVHFASSGELNVIDPIFNEIILDENLTPEIQTYILLHECGHILLWENGMFMDLEKKAGREIDSSERERTYTVIEEVEAWKRGFFLAKRLGIPINMVKWEKEMASAIGKYIKWAADPVHYESECVPKP